MNQQVDIQLTLTANAELSKEEIQKKIEDMFNFATLHSSAHERMLIPEIKIVGIQEEAEIRDTPTPRNFPNGFLNWFETSIEIAEPMFTALRNDEIELDGRGELWELIEQYTDEFEKKYEGVEWGEDPIGDWFDVVDDFAKEKINLLKEQKS